MNQRAERVLKRGIRLPAVRVDVGEGIIQAGPGETHEVAGLSVKKHWCTENDVPPFSSNSCNGSTYPR